MEISHKLFTSWLNDLTLIGSEDVIKEILRRNLQKFHSLFCKALGLLQGTFPSMLAPRFVSAATSLIRFVQILPSRSNHLRFYNGFIEIMRHCEDENEFIRVFLYRFVQIVSLCFTFSCNVHHFLHSLTWSFSGYILNHDREKFVDMLKDEVAIFLSWEKQSLAIGRWSCLDISQRRSPGTF